MKIISVLNHKGGVGKTTFTGSTAQALALLGFRVLAIDNDSQHNLSSLLCMGVKMPNIRQVYLSSPSGAPAQLLRSIFKTEIEDLHIITSCRDLCDADVSDPMLLGRSFHSCGLERFYDYVLIDNAPGIDKLQESAIRASDEIFVPTELKQFAVDGLVEMEKTLSARYPDGAKISRIIPNFYRNTIRQNAFIAALEKLFPGKVTGTHVPLDQVFDEVVTEGKILFLHRLYSRGAAYYLKLVHELFDLDEEEIWEKVMARRKQRISEEARERIVNRKEHQESVI
ncbi:MAG: ParA family protein [Fibrobacter sp.]|nr:ParA family protein [Fibrobacter sp.]